MHALHSKLYLARSTYGADGFARVATSPNTKEGGLFALLLFNHGK